MPSKHSSAPKGPDLQETLEACQIMSIRYTEFFRLVLVRMGPLERLRGAHLG